MTRKKERINKKQKYSKKKRKRKTVEKKKKIEIERKNMDNCGREKGTKGKKEREKALARTVIADKCGKTMNK